MKTAHILSAVAAAVGVHAQNNGSVANGCNAGFYPGTDTVILTTPYTYAQVMSIIGDYQNLTWSGNPDGTVTLNGTDNTVGTARFYDTAGAPHVIETIKVYSKPANGPYEEVHALDLVTVAAANVSFYSDYDGTTVVETCNGAASTFNFTINFCATNPTIAASILHSLHLTDAQTVGMFLGGQNYTSCAAISNSTNSPMPTPSAVSTGAGMANAVSISALTLAVGGVLLWAGI